MVLSSELHVYIMRHSGNGTTFVSKCYPTISWYGYNILVMLVTSDIMCSYTCFYHCVVVVGFTASDNATSADPVAAIHLPPEVFQGLGRDMNPGLVFTIYINSVLFPVGNSSGTRLIRSPVIGAFVAGQDPPKNLSNPVQIILLLVPESDVSCTAVWCS